MFTSPTSTYFSDSSCSNVVSLFLSKSFISEELSENGTLKGFDQTINLILDESHERVYSNTAGVEQVVLGLYIIRGDNIAVIGEVDDDVDTGLDLPNIRADPLNAVIH
ncbi:U6 snRNA-associated Sm-like protein LSm8 isoform X1 [Lytechinus variegatus]|uniref:U6 snRNA-associated Sm-like protein LSm8 isoform X1 n=1 Tax=Lytechinus variegatus TaxID=7654 RepID=UPI001BB1CDD7|nr:U6 snRNA-associated Sm-like protein LSm8 isoform X1 [Lytechinus variegatus]